MHAASHKGEHRVCLVELGFGMQALWSQDRVTNDTEFLGPLVGAGNGFRMGFISDMARVCTFRNRGRQGLLQLRLSLEPDGICLAGHLGPSRPAAPTKGRLRSCGTAPWQKVHSLSMSFRLCHIRSCRHVAVARQSRVLGSYVEAWQCTAHQRFDFHAQLRCAAAALTHTAMWFGSGSRGSRTSSTRLDRFWPLSGWASCGAGARLATPTSTCASSRVTCAKTARACANSIECFCRVKVSLTCPTKLQLERRYECLLSCSGPEAGP